ncbi:MAG TPA: DUF1153 domain-containing protein [Alphaproteobacteria bacterium]|nr:DUF1153 domain-containing protein [Alphaproteobacteria bacterium]
MSQSSAHFSTHGEQVKIVRISDRQKELDRLPPPDTQRWVMRRKAQVVAAVRSGLLTFEEVCQRYRLSEEEFKSWMDLLDHHGVRGLRATRMQEYRPAEERTRETTAE